MEPSAFIPFCEFGGNMSAMSINKEPFKVPICNSFRDKILNDQLCYEVDLNKFSNKNNIDRYLKSGFYFVMDYNEDLQLTFEELSNKSKNIGLANSFTESYNDNHAFIYLNTIGKILFY